MTAITTSAAAPLPPIVRTVSVNADAESAFRRFTVEMGRWWPLASHSVGEARSEGITFEPRAGGRIVERIAGGTEAVWGVVTAWEPPHRVAFTWHPGQSPSTAQDIEVRFAAAGEATLVTLTHQGFERLGSDAAKAYRGYPIGWSYVLGRYAERADVGMVLLGGLMSVLMFVMRLTARRGAAAE
jgi:uncharacterized protein YndB with AHSA1/START domain